MTEGFQKQNPFSLYDFLGYFVPGAAAILVTREALSGTPFATTAIGGLLWSIDLSKAGDYLPFVMGAYVLGHLLSFLSSVTVERYSIWIVGYPSKYLLELTSSAYWNPESRRGLRRVIRTGVGLFLLPVSVLDWLLGNLAGMREVYCSPLDAHLVSVIKRKVETLLVAIEPKIVLKKGGAYQTDYFRVAYHHTLEKAPAHNVKFQNYVALYGFLRTLTLIAVLAWWVEVLTITDRSFVQAVLSALMSAALPYTLFMAFMKFYRRFSLEVLMALVVTLPVTDDQDNS